ncbi:MAG: magnesium/cobalt transporter CorA [Saprospiraceae bacterium]
MPLKKRKNLKKKKPGLPPGQLIFTGRGGQERPILHLIHYNAEHFSEKTITDNYAPHKVDGQVTWLDLRSLSDETLVESIGKFYKIHPLVLEDVLNVQQRPKFEEYDNGIFIVARALTYNTEALSLETEQIGIFFGKDFIVSFQENIDDTFEPVRERLRAGRGRIRSSGPDYLAYALLDKILDDYFHILDSIETEMEQLEDAITENPDDGHKSRIHDLKFQLLYLRKSVVPLREAINSFARSDAEYVSPETGIFLRDLYDHAIRIADLVDTFRDITTGLQELYLSELSLRMNKVMQLLTIITTIFVPLTFIVGIYGMNFRYMPELEWKYGYPAVMLFMLVLALLLLLYFRRKKWL